MELAAGKHAGGNAASNDAMAIANTQRGVTSVVNQGFAKGFCDEFVARCVIQAQATTPLEVNSTPTCGCSADKLLASKSPADLMKGGLPTDAQAVAVACAEEHPITLPKS